MSHWSETARSSASATMGTGAVDAAVQECVDRSWEPLAEIDALPDWELQAEILADEYQAAANDSGR